VLITDGPFERVRHPIYGYQVLLMLASLAVVPTLPMLVVAAIHVALMVTKARNEEAYLLEIHGDAYADYSWAVNIANVDVDPLTAQPKLLDLVAVQDAGRIVNPVLATGQVEGGAAQAIGFALYENVIYQNGKVANPNLSNYIIPTAVDLPPIRAFFIESCDTPKGLGELPMNAPAPAIANAIANLLNIPVNHLPITPERILACSPSL
jgi:CO/xanthine dehydrogenase Mo-binding subunit